MRFSLTCNAQEETWNILHQSRVSQIVEQSHPPRCVLKKNKGKIKRSMIILKSIILVNYLIALNIHRLQQLLFYITTVTVAL